MTKDKAADAMTQTVQVDWQAELAGHDRWLRGIVAARVGEPQAVDDVMQEIALAAVRQQAPLEDATKVAPWLYRLAVTQSLLYRRSAGRRRKLKDRYTERFQPSESGGREQDPLRWLLADERRELVRQTVQSLPGKDAEILMLKYAESWSYKKIANTLKISTSAVEARLHRARARLRDRLAAAQVTEVTP
ncbi:MAG: RNA polymerase sigma factor [Planctomycetota bacterium]|nr:RNA polymerase sigma factor [Planctomycetota bacterium]